MKPKVYLETTLISYLAAKPSRDIIIAAHQELTAVEDALHIAVAVIHGMDYLLTCNCKHIANAEKGHAIATVCRSNNYEPPIICTPEELMGG